MMTRRLTTMQTLRSRTRRSVMCGGVLLSLAAPATGEAQSPLCPVDGFAPDIAALTRLACPFARDECDS
jgi:hypothetical protein